MYIQNRIPQEKPFSLPKGYSGNAFAMTQATPSMQEAPIPQEIPVVEESTLPPAPEEPAATEETPPAEEERGGGESTEAVAAFAPQRDDRHREHGLFSKIPFLSSLLPPPRKKHGNKETLPEWAILGIVLFLLLDTPENDLLPFLLLLLLWD